MCIIIRACTKVWNCSHWQQGVRQAGFDAFLIFCYASDLSEKKKLIKWHHDWCSGAIHRTSPPTTGYPTDNVYLGYTFEHIDTLMYFRGMFITKHRARDLVWCQRYGCVFGNFSSMRRKLRAARCNTSYRDAFEQNKVNYINRLIKETLTRTHWFTVNINKKKCTFGASPT